MLIAGRTHCDIDRRMVTDALVCTNVHRAPVCDSKTGFRPSRSSAGHISGVEAGAGHAFDQNRYEVTNRAAVELLVAVVHGVADDLNRHIGKCRGKSLRYLGDCPDLIVICHRSMMAPPSWASPTVRGQGFFAEGPG